jgi:hypothetical protein
VGSEAAAAAAYSSSVSHAPAIVMVDRDSDLHRQQIFQHLSQPSIKHRPSMNTTDYAAGIVGRNQWELLSFPDIATVILGNSSLDPFFWDLLAQIGTENSNWHFKQSYGLNAL